MDPVPIGVVLAQSEVEQLLKVTAPLGSAGSFEPLAPTTVAVSVTGWPDVGAVRETARAVVVTSVYWAVPVYEKAMVAPAQAS
jgi:hypothetical protein